MIRHLSLRWLAGLLLLCGPAWLPAATPGCAGRADCLENPNFTTEVVDLRTSTSGRYRMVTATMRFHNRLDRPLTLAYVGNSGVVTDDQGNRYLVGSSGVRGIGVVSGNTFDSKFTLDPGESSEARFEFAWQPGREIVGTQFNVDVTLREIDPVAGGQFRLGRERVLHFAAPVGRTAAPAVAATPVPAAPAVAPVAQADPCAGIARCASTGAFMAQVTAVTPQGGPKDRHHTLVLNVRFRNTGAEPLVLGYKASSSKATDNLGNPYIPHRPGTHDTSAAGIGTITSREANASFVMRPGESRDATFTVVRYNSQGKQLGTGWVYDVVVARLEILPSQPVRVDRDYSLHFTGLTGGVISGAPASINEAVQGLKDLFRK